MNKSTFELFGIPTTQIVPAETSELANIWNTAIAK